MFNLTAFLSYVFVVTFTPGPNNIMAMVNASKFGFRRTVKFLLGVFTGFFIILILSAYFNLVLFSLMPKIKVFMEILGAGYMLYLAVKIIKSKEPEVNKDVEEDCDSNSFEKISEKSDSLNSFYTGMTMQFVNPKAILYCITVISNFIIPYFNSNIILLYFSFFLAFIGLMSTASWALFGSLFNKFLSEYRRAFNIAMGLLLIYSALSISGITSIFH